MNRFKTSLLSLVLLSAIVFPTNIFAATVQEKIAGLYVAFFNRAADKSGLEYWEGQAAALGEESAVKTLAFGFSTHTKFTSLYGSMNNQEYVEAIYINTLGQAGDSEGIAYWTGLIDNGMSRSDMVAEFVSLSLDFERTDPQYASLSEDVLDTAQQRKDLLVNKVTVSLAFVNILNEESNLDPSTDAMDPDALDADETYQASVNIISNITHETTTLETALNLISMISAYPSDAMEVINELISQYGAITDDTLIVGNIQATIDGTAPTTPFTDGVSLGIDKVTITANEMQWQEFEDDGSETYTTFVTGSDENDSYVVETNNTITIADGDFSVKYLSTVAYDVFNTDNNTTFTSAVTIHKIAFIANVEEYDYFDDIGNLFYTITNDAFTTLESMVDFWKGGSVIRQIEGYNLGFRDDYNGSATSGILTLKEQNGTIVSSNAGSWEIVTVNEDRVLKVTPTNNGDEVTYPLFVELNGLVYHGEWNPINFGGINYFINQAGRDEFVTYFNANKDSIADQLFETETLLDYRTAFDSETALDPAPFIAEGVLYLPWIDIHQ